MNTTTAILTIAMMLVVGLASADEHVVLKVKRSSIVKDPTVRLVTLASGAQHPVKISDIDFAVGAKLTEAARREVVVLNVKEVTGQVLTLASGAQLTVKGSDIERNLSAKLAEAIRAASADRAAAVPTPPDPEGARLAGIQRKCQKDWPKDAQKRADCQKQQQEALVAVQARSIETSAQREIRILCVRGWADDYVGQNSCEEQRIGWLIDGKYSVRSVPTTPAVSPSGIRQKCEKEWPTNFQMRVYCEDQQQKAFSALQSRSMVTADQQTIRSECAREWSDDYQMQNYCEEQQLKALKALGR